MPGTDSSSVGRRAMWVWSRPDPVALVRWAAEQHVEVVFMATPDVFTPGETKRFERLVSTAHASGIGVAALGGDPRWIELPERGLAWLRASTAVGLFDGIHLDVEPWLRPGWDGPRQAAYVRLLAELKGACSLPVEADIPFWLHTLDVAGHGPLDEAVMRQVDAVTVLTFRNRARGPDSITEIGASALASASRVGLPCRFAAETNYLGLDPEDRKQTFHGLGRRALDRALAEVDQDTALVEAYRGVAVQDYAGWRALGP